MPWSDPRLRRSLTMGEQANSCGSISRVSSFSLCFSSLQVFHIWFCLFIRRLVLNLLLGLLHLLISMFLDWYGLCLVILALAEVLRPNFCFVQWFLNFSLSCYYKNWIWPCILYSHSARISGYKMIRHYGTLNELLTGGKIEI